MSLFGIFGLGPWELGAIALVAVLLFGSRLPEVGRSIGKSIVEFKKGMKDVENEIEQKKQRGVVGPNSLRFTLTS